MKKNNNKGFTLAELLIVVAIIAVLVAIAIPVFTAQLKKSKAATDQANARSLYAVIVADYLDDLKYNPNGSEITSVSIIANSTTTYGSNSFKWSDVLTSGTVTLGENPSVSITTNGTTYTFGGAGST